MTGKGKFRSKCFNCGKYGHKNHQCRAVGGGAYNGGDDKKNKKPCTHCGSEKHTYNTCWKKHPWLKEHVCENCGRKGHCKEHCLKKKNNDQNNISIDAMMNMVDVEKDENKKDESEVMWERLNNVFGKLWCGECNSEESHL